MSYIVNDEQVTITKALYTYGDEFAHGFISFSVAGDGLNPDLIARLDQVCKDLADDYSTTYSVTRSEVMAQRFLSGVTTEEGMVDDLDTP